MIKIGTMSVVMENDIYTDIHYTFKIWAMSLLCVHESCKLVPHMYNICIEL